METSKAFKKKQNDPIAEEDSGEENIALNTSFSPRLYSYVSNAKDKINRYVFGIHAKTKRSLSEEAEIGDEDSVNSWIISGVDPNELDAYNYTPLINASALGRLHVVEELIKNGADVNKTGDFGFSALHAAAQVNQ